MGAEFPVNSALFCILIFFLLEPSSSMCVDFFLFFDWLYLSAKEKVSKIRIIFAVCRLP